MASSQGLLLAVSLLVCASTCLGIDLAGHPARKLATTEPLAPTGLWQSISIVGSSNTSVSCGLRDFPPIPDGYGSSRMLCGGSVAKFDPYWVWKLTKIPSDSVPDVLAPGASDIVTGELVHLRIFNPMLTYCQTVSKGQVKCGVMFNQAALFSVEKVDNSAAGQQVDFNTDVLYLKSNNMYCRLNGKASSSFIYCDQTTAVTATKFRMPYSHYYSVSLSSLLNSNQFCGANFIPLSGPSSAVNCTGTGLIPGNYYTKFVLSAKVPGSSFLSSGMAYAITAYDNLYHYQVATWMAAATGAVDSISNDTSGDRLWFILEIPEAAVGTPLDSGSVVLIKNQKLNKYCGLATGSSQLKCDMDAIPTSTGYLFTFSLA